ncbi:hypothetical protein V3C33_09425 [Micrococcaceae bacterium Sec5.7]
MTDRRKYTQRFRDEAVELVISSGRPIAQVCVDIEAEKANHPIAWLCRALKVSRALFYRWRNPAGPSPRAVRHEQLAAEVTGLFEKEKGRDGSDQLTLMLNAKGVEVSAPTVGAIMR